MPNPPTAAPSARASAQKPASAAAGVAMRRRRVATQSAGRTPLRSAERSDVADAKPPTKKKSGITWPIQVNQPYPGEKSSRLPPVSSP